VDAVQGAAEKRKEAVLKYCFRVSQAATPQCATSGDKGWLCQAFSPRSAFLGS